MIELDQGEIARDRWGRPQLPDLGTLTRTSTLAKTLDDQSSLSAWKARKAVVGVATSVELQTQAAAADPDDRDTLNRVVSSALERTQASAGARTGTLIHSATEALDHGRSIEGLPSKIRTDAQAYRTAIVSAGLSPLAAELFVVCPELGCAGSFDRILQGPSRVLIGDLKTSGSADTARYASLSWSIQIAVYAHSFPWLPGQGVVSWSDVGLPAPDLEKGLVIHVQQGTGLARLYSVNLDAGWAAAQQALEVRAMRKRRDLVTEVG